MRRGRSYEASSPAAEEVTDEHPSDGCQDHPQPLCPGLPALANVVHPLLQERDLGDQRRYARNFAADILYPLFEKRDVLRQFADDFGVGHVVVSASRLHLAIDQLLDQAVLDIGP